MKLLRCDGRTLEVYDVAGPLYQLRAAVIPIKAPGWQIVDDPTARRLLEELRASKLYEGGRVEEAVAK